MPCCNSENLRYAAIAIPARVVIYDSIEGGPDLFRAEVWFVCHSYLKVIHQETDPQVDPVAYDLATLTLDLLRGEHIIAGLPSGRAATAV